MKREYLAIWVKHCYISAFLRGTVYLHQCPDTQHEFPQGRYQSFRHWKESVHIEWKYPHVSLFTVFLSVKFLIIAQWFGLSRFHLQIGHCPFKESILKRVSCTRVLFSRTTFSENLSLFYIQNQVSNFKTFFIVVCFLVFSFRAFVLAL